MVEVQVLNSGKMGSLNILPVLFIPLHSVEEVFLIRIKEAKTLFLQPLVEELESLFVTGFSANFAYPPQVISRHLCTDRGPVVLRVMLMMVTGDHPAQTKIGMLKASGKAPCRRCVCHSSLLNGHYVYGNNRQQFIEPPPRRSSDELCATVTRWKRAPSEQVKEAILQEGGVSGEFVLWRLFHLYDFDISLDLVFDVMHITSLNLFKNYISKLFLELIEVGVNMEEMKQLCSMVSNARPYELRQGRWPNSPVDLHTSYMAEENQLFIQWILPHVLNLVQGQISYERQQLGLLLVDISHYFFNYTRVNGWTVRDTLVVKRMLHSWRVLSEELDGPNGAPLEHVAGKDPYNIFNVSFILFESCLPRNHFF